MAKARSAPRRQDSLDGELAPLDEAFDQDRVLEAAAHRAHVLAREQRVEPREGGIELARVESARMTPRLPESPSGLTTHGKRTRESRAADARVGRATRRRTRAPAGRPPPGAGARASCWRSRPPRPAGCPEGRAPAPRAPRARRDGRRPQARRRSAARSPRPRSPAATRPPRESAPAPRRRATGRRGDDTDRWRRSGRSPLARQTRQRSAAGSRSSWTG